MFEKYLKIILLITLCSFAFSQAPPEFEHNQSQSQGGYLFLSADINGEQLEEDDWLGAFNDLNLIQPNLSF